MRIKGIRVQWIDPINSLWPFLTQHTTNGCYLHLTNYLYSSLWRGQSSSYHWVNHWLAPWDYPSLGWEGTHSIFGVWPLPINLWGNFPLCFLIETLTEIDRLPKIPSTGSWRLENQTTRLSFITSGGGMCTQTSTLMISCGWIWSKGPNGSDRSIRVASMIQFFLACSRWGS